MSKSNEQSGNVQGSLWECKECHAMITSYETIAYHLVDRILYGWCEPCFTNRRQDAIQAAAA